MRLKSTTKKLFAVFGDVFGTSGSNWCTVHFFLLVFRFFCIFLFGYPHPDEFFQSPEIAAADIFEFNVFVPWEFADITNPCRSIISPLIGSSIGYTILYVISYIIPSLLNAFTLLIFPRSIIFILSLVTDFTLARLFKWKGDDPGVGLFLLGTSWAMLVMHTRPFSNILESFFVTTSILLYFIPQELFTPALRSWRFILFGAVFALGIFTRFTFVFFFFPVALAVLYELLLEPCHDLPLNFWNSSNLPATSALGESHRKTYILKAVILGLSGIFLVSSVLVILDSVYFGSLQLTVMNSFLYNLDSSNLAAHGIHPRYLHSLVNMHILFGPLWLFALTAVIYSVSTNLFSFMKNPRAFLYQPGPAEEKNQESIPKDNTSNPPNIWNDDPWNRIRSRIDGPSLRKSMSEPGNGNLRVSSDHQVTKYFYDSKRSWKIFYVCFGSIISGCGLLSVAKHQEPRFLLPLLLPLIVIFGSRFFQRKPLVITWLAFNLIFVLFFGVLHQGGVIPSLMYVQQQSSSVPPTFSGIDVRPEYGLDVLYFKTFMPPRFLIAQPKAGQYPVRLHDPGRSEEVLLHTLQQLQDKHCASGLEGNKSAFIVSPSLVSLPQEIRSAYTTGFPVKTFWPHFSSEDPPQSIYDFWEATLNIYPVQFNCNNN